MVEWTEQREEVVFVSFGEKNAKPGSYIVKENEAIEGLILKVIDSPMYKKVYQLQIKGSDKPHVITGKTSLIEQMGHGTKNVTPVKEGDLVRITYLGMFKTGKGKDAYKFKVEVGK